MQENNDEKENGEKGHHYHHLYLIFELVEEGDVVVRGDFLALPEHKMTMMMRTKNYDKKCDKYDKKYDKIRRKM